MKKLNQKGYGAVEIVLILVIIGLITFVAWYVFHTKSNTDSTLGTAANTQTESATSKKTATTSASSVVVVTKTDSKLGQYLADANGMALYTYDLDTAGKSNCTGSCLTEWPIYKAPASASNLQANVTVITRSDGTSQYAYKQMPLYTFTSDSAGKVTGDGIQSFHVAKP